MTQTDTELQQALLRLNARAWGIAFGLLLGGGLFIATVVLVMRGGENVGQHLGLLRVFFPGNSISYAGAIIGFIYAFVVSYAFGRLVGSAYNFLVRPR